MVGAVESNPLTLDTMDCLVLPLSAITPGAPNIVTHAISLLIVNHYPLECIGLRAVLEPLQDLRLIGEAETGLVGLRMATHSRPDIVLLDVRLPDRSGSELCEEILRAVPSTRILFLSGYEDRNTMLSAIRAGAHGYLLKNETAMGLVAAIRTLAAGHSVLDSQITGEAMASIRDPVTLGPQRGSALSRQEERVLKLVSDGKTNKEIASLLSLSDKTVKNYLANVYEKLQVTRRAQATAIYVKAGFPENDVLRHSALLRSNPLTKD